MDMATPDPNLVIEILPSMAFGENHWIGSQIRIDDSVRIEVIAPTPRCAVDARPWGLAL
jgi:hypothetical protein